MGSGVHTLEFRYTKDSSVNSGADRVYIDMLDIPPLVCAIDQHANGAGGCIPCTGGTWNAAGDDATGAATVCDDCGPGEQVVAGVCTSCTANANTPNRDDPSGPNTQCLCDENHYVSSMSCAACSTRYINEAGDNPLGPDTMCYLEPTCPYRGQSPSASSCEFGTPQDYSITGNDISTVTGSLQHCKDTCCSTSGCVAVQVNRGQDDDSGSTATCYLKSSNGLADRTTVSLTDTYQTYVLGDVNHFGGAFPFVGSVLSSPTDNQAILYNQAVRFDAHVHSVSFIFRISPDETAPDTWALKVVSLPESSSPSSSATATVVRSQDLPRPDYDMLGIAQTLVVDPPLLAEVGTYLVLEHRGSNLRLQTQSVSSSWHGGYGKGYRYGNPSSDTPGDTFSTGSSRDYTVNLRFELRYLACLNSARSCFVLPGAPGYTCDCKPSFGLDRCIDEDPDDQCAGYTTSSSSAASGNINLAIPNNNVVGVSHSLTVPSGLPSITTAPKVHVKVTHTWKGDLHMWLTRESDGLTVKFFNCSGGGDDMDVVFSGTEGSNSLPCRSNSVTGTYWPAVTQGEGKLEVCSA